MGGSAKSRGLMFEVGTGVKTHSADGPSKWYGLAVLTDVQRPILLIVRLPLATRTGR